MQTRRTITVVGTTVAVLMVLGGLSAVERHASFSAGTRADPPGAAWSSRRNDVARPTRRTSTGTRSRWKIRIIDELSGVYGPYTGRWFGTKSETDIEHMVARSEGAR